MKKFTLSLIMITSVFYSFSQIGTYLVTTQESTCPTSPMSFIYSVIITDPNGLTTVQVLPHAINDAVNYNIQFNQIVSSIYNLGYHLVPIQFDGHMVPTTGVPICTQVMKYYLFAPCCAPWTSSGIEPEGVNNSQFKLLNAFPNPTQEKITVEFDYTNESVPDKILLFDLLGNELCQHDITDLISKIITLDVSKFEGGLYLLVLKSKNQYSIPYDIVIQ